MRNINELIGIIEGINYDGIVNSKEAEHLQIWVDKNRNLAYEQNQIALIDKVDTVLEDHMITEKEREELLQISKRYLDDIGDNTSKIYELNGIIIGIICDGIVNESEIRNLRSWMMDNSSLVRENKSCEELCRIIDKILEDGVVTESEQTELLNLLSARIRDAQFQTRLDYLCKLVRERKNIGVDLIDLLDNESAVMAIHHRAENQLLSGLASLSGFVSDTEIVVVSLVLIAMLSYDGNYYDSVRSTYNRAYEKYSEQKVEGLIRSILSRYKKKDESGSRERIINVALENAIVPQTYLSAFFDFIFDIYKINFEYDLPDDPYEDFEFVFEGLKKSMLSDGDSLSIAVTQKTYKLIVSTKQLIIKEDGMDALIKFSTLVAKLIDKRYWNKEVKLCNSYLKTGYNKWESQLKESVKAIEKRDHTTSDFRSRWEPKFVLQNNVVYLVPPVHRVKAQYDYRNIAVVVLNGDEEIFRDNCPFIKEIIGGYQINPNKIQINNPLGKLSYRLVAGEEVIYDSKSKLCRNYIVFDSEGQEIQNNTDYEGAAVFCYKQGEAELKELLCNEFYVLGFSIVREEDAIKIGKDVFIFSSIVKPGVFGELHQNCFILYREAQLPIFKEVSVLSFEAANISSKFEIIINGKPQKLSDFTYKTTVKGNVTKYVVELHLEFSGIYEVEVNQFNSGKRIRILKKTFCYDPSLKFDALKVSESAFRVSVISDLLSKRIEQEYQTDAFERFDITFDYKGDSCSFLLPLDIGLYRIDNGVWKNMDTELWIEDISLDSILSVYDSEVDELYVYTSAGKLAEDNVAVNDKGFYKEIPIGFITSYKSSNNYIILLFMANGRRKYMAICYNRCVLDEEKTEVIFTDNPKKVSICPVFHGKGKIICDVIDSAGRKVYTSVPLFCGEVDTLKTFESFEEYTFSFREVPKKLSLTRGNLLGERKCTFYSKADFTNKVFKIDRVYFNQTIRGEFVEKIMHLNKAYVRIIGTLEEDFRGEVFVKTMRGEWKLNAVNPVRVEVCSDIIDDTIDIYITNELEGDGLLVDFEKHGIMNALVHKTAPDIFLYTASMKGANET